MPRKASRKGTSGDHKCEERVPAVTGLGNPHLPCAGQLPSRADRGLWVRGPGAGSRGCPPSPSLQAWESGAPGPNTEVPPLSQLGRRQWVCPVLLGPYPVEGPLPLWRHLTQICGVHRLPCSCHREGLHRLTREPCSTQCRGASWPTQGDKPR